MLKVFGQGIIYKKDVKQNNNGSYWVRFTIKTKDKTGDKKYNASLVTDSEMEAETFCVGDAVYLEGNWDIKRIKQQDGSIMYYNTINLDKIDRYINNNDGEKEPW